MSLVLIRVGSNHIVNGINSFVHLFQNDVTKEQIKLSFMGI